MTNEVVRIREGLGHGRFDGASLAARALLAAENFQQSMKALVFGLFIPTRRKAAIAFLNCDSQRRRVVRLVYGQENVVAMTRNVLPPHRALLIHGENVAIHPEQIQREVAADLITIVVASRL